MLNNIKIVDMLFLQDQLRIKCQSYPKSTKMDEFEQKICNVTAKLIYNLGMGGGGSITVKGGFF